MDSWHSLTEKTVLSLAYTSLTILPSSSPSSSHLWKEERVSCFQAFYWPIGTSPPKLETMENRGRKIHGHWVNEEHWRNEGTGGQRRRAILTWQEGCEGGGRITRSWRTNVFFNPQVSQSVRLLLPMHRFYIWWANDLIQFSGYQLQFSYSDNGDYWFHREGGRRGQEKSINRSLLIEE